MKIYCARRTLVYTGTDSGFENRANRVHRLTVDALKAMPDIEGQMGKIDSLKLLKETVPSRSFQEGWPAPEDR